MLAVTSRPYEGRGPVLSGVEAWVGWISGSGLRARSEQFGACDAGDGAAGVCGHRTAYQAPASGHPSGTGRITRVM